MMVVLAFLLSGAAAAAQPVREPWATVTKDPASAREKSTIAFGTLGVAREKPFELAYYAKRTVQRGDEAPQVTWAGSAPH